ncbi:MAG: hypothetical protein ABI999_07090 [Acidobacteriota bacterium]
MKTVLRSISPWPMTIIAIALLSGFSFGQTSNDECTTVYNAFLANRKSPEIEKLQAAIASGKEYLDKCSTLEEGEKVKDYVSRQVPLLQDAVQDQMNYKGLDAALKARDVHQTFTYGKKVLEKHPENLEVILAVASAGYSSTHAANPTDKYNDETIRLAKLAISKLDDPAKAAEADYFKTDKCPDGRTNAVGSMNLAIGNITWSRLKDKKAALPYLYKSLQTGCSTKALPETYQKIGAAYREEFQKLEDDRQAKIKAAEGKETEESGKILALEMGYLDRMLDTYGRAYKAETDSGYGADDREHLLSDLKSLYGGRHEDDMSGFDAWLKGMGTDQLPDPTSTVAPVAAPSPTASPKP